MKPPPLPEPTLNSLYRLHPLLFAQLACIFGRQVAGEIVLETHRNGVGR